MDFSSFLLRYHKELDYRDFSDSKEVLARIKRAESYRAWADIEDLANSYETIGQNFENHKATAAEAFNELYQHIKKFKRDVELKL